MAKKRGAPPGNANALKHGYYTRRFRDVEPQDLEVISGNLTNEIAGMRVAARRIMEYSERVEDEDPMKAVSALNSFGLACIRIAGLSKTLAALTGNTDESQTAISIALRKVTDILNLKGDS
jgi:3',5'-cyclic AMP phosphodiesterase CpdA